jgi:hypothetical protein
MGKEMVSVHLWGRKWCQFIYGEGNGVSSFIGWKYELTPDFSLAGNMN